MSYCLDEEYVPENITELENVRRKPGLRRSERIKENNASKKRRLNYCDFIQNTQRNRKPSKRRKTNNTMTMLDNVDDDDDDDVDLMQDTISFDQIHSTHSTNYSNHNHNHKKTADDKQNVTAFINKIIEENDDTKTIKCANYNCHLLIGIMKEQCLNDIIIDSISSKSTIRECKICKIKLCYNCFNKKNNDNKCHSCNIHNNKIGIYECSVCGIFIARNGYSKSQQKKEPKQRKCKRCVMWINALNMI